MRTQVTCPNDFAEEAGHRRLFERSRITFYFAEGLKKLAQDQMLDQKFFDTLLSEFADGLTHSYTAPHPSGLDRLRTTVTEAQSMQLGGHVLAPHVRANDREGMCHQLANEGLLTWCGQRK